MAEVELTLTDDQVQALLSGEGGLAVVLQAVLNRVLESEMTDHLAAAPHERTEARRGYRNGRYERDLTLRVERAFVGRARLPVRVGGRDGDQGAPRRPAC